MTPRKQEESFSNLHALIAQKEETYKEVTEELGQVSATRSAQKPVSDRFLRLLQKPKSKRTDFALAN